MYKQVIVVNKGLKMSPGETWGYGSTWGYRILL